MIPELVSIRDGRFVMGDDHGRFDERPAHEVSIDACLLGRFPVTNREYASYLTDTGALEPRFWRDQCFAHPLQPVVGVSWFEAIAYCEWLTATTGQIHRLPTEAEREWAATGGIPGARYPWGAHEPALVGPWARGSAGQHQPLPVSGDSPNGFGLCHMADNVHEWCSDWWDPGYYGVSPMCNPQGPASGVRRASRGGAWRHDLKFSRCSARSSLSPDFRYNDYGFRVAAEGP